MESQPQNPEFRNNPDNFHPCKGAHGNKYGILINSNKLSRCSSLSLAPIIGFPREGGTRKSNLNFSD